VVIGLPRDTPKRAAAATESALPRDAVTICRSDLGDLRERAPDWLMLQKQPVCHSIALVCNAASLFAAAQATAAALPPGYELVDGDPITFGHFLLIQLLLEELKALPITRHAGW